MAKEAYYFSHDANARQDEKILMLRAEHSWEGYGIYWALIEMMFESSDSALHHNKIKGIAVSYNIDITLLQHVINTCITEELFASDNDKFWSESLSRRKSKFLDSKEKKSEAGKKGMAKRYGKQHSNNGVITEPNKGKESKVNESKVKEIKTSIKDSGGNSYQNVFGIFEREIGELTDTVKDLLIDYELFYSEDWVKQAIKSAVKQDVKKLSYIEGTLKKWKLLNHGEPWTLEKGVIPLERSEQGNTGIHGKSSTPLTDLFAISS